MALTKAFREIRVVVIFLHIVRYEASSLFFLKKNKFLLWETQR